MVSSFQKNAAILKGDLQQRNALIVARLVEILSGQLPLCLPENFFACCIKQDTINQILGNT